jgi:putative transcriptional regulator
MTMRKDDQGSPLGDEMLAGLTAFRDALRSGDPIEKKFTVRTVTLDLEAKPYSAEDVKAVRARLRASQGLLAKFLGVSVKTLCAWEQGTRPVPSIACRFLDELIGCPELWNRRVRSTGSSNGPA